MRMKSLFGILTVGGVLAYIHKKRGGEFTLASFKESAQKVVRSLGFDKLLGRNPEQQRSRDEAGTHSSYGRHGGMRPESGPGNMGH